MTPWEGIRLALRQIRAQKLKSFFSLLGVIIGVTFLIVVVSVVEGLDRYITEDFARQVYGINTVTVRRRPSVRIDPDPAVRRSWSRRPRLTHGDADAIRERLDLPARVGVESSAGGIVSSDLGRTVENVRVNGISSTILEIRALEIERGRPFTEQEARRGVPVVVLGASTARALFPRLDPVGRRVRIAASRRRGGGSDGGSRYRVVGVLEKRGSVLGVSLDNLALAPAPSPVAKITAPPGAVDEIVVQALGQGSLEAVRTELEAIMRVRHGLRPTDPNDFELETADQSLSFWSRVSRVLYLALPGLVGISLVVGGIVIMNIMLVSVLERTREIGVRKAVGARRRDVVLQVLFESATLSGIGAGVGAGIGVTTAAVVRAASSLPVTVPVLWVAVGLGLGVGTGVLAGVYPAARAAALDPVDALRHE